MEQHDADAVVIGAGVIGLACARALALRGREVIVLEAETLIASHTSSRNSEVIHAGIYYAEGSNKARFCVAGRRALYDYLDSRKVTAKRCGKLVVAVDDDEAEAVSGLLARARRNDVEGLELVSGAAAREMEPALNPAIQCAMHSPVSGIFDSHGYFLALQGDLEDRGGMIAFSSPILSGEVSSDGVDLHVGGASPARMKARTVVNAAGHTALDVAKSIDGAYDGAWPTPRYVKGSYFTISGKTPFSRLIYPMPTRSSLGLHLTIDLAGRGKLGPDAEWLEEAARPPFDYSVDAKRAEHFYASARRYWPDLPDGALNPDYSGVRPKLVGPGDPSGDFKIEPNTTDGAAAVINLFGIESPGLTSSLAIADAVAALTD